MSAGTDMSAKDADNTLDNAAHSGCPAVAGSPSSVRAEPWIGNCPKCHSAYRTHAPEDTSKPLELKCGRMDCVGMVIMTPIEGFQETDNDTEAELAAWELLRDTRAELEELRDAVRNMRDVKGRFHTQLATERLIALLPENAKEHTTPRNEA